MPSKRRAYAQRSGAKKPSVDLGPVLGATGLIVCQKAAQHFLGLGASKVQRVLYGLPDRRRKGSRLPHEHAQPMTTICKRFLWHVYQFHAEGLPDRWHLDATASRSLVLHDERVPLPQRPDPIGSESTEEPLPPLLDWEQHEEDQARAIAQVSLYMNAVTEPHNLVLFGPNVHVAPRRYIGVARPVQLYGLFQKWCEHHSCPVPCFTTFLRAFHGASSYLRFRKVAGQHANCDACARFKTNSYVGHSLFLSARRLWRTIPSICSSSGWIVRRT